MAVREAILDHMVRTAHLLLFQHIRSSHTSVQSYIASSKMDKVWFLGYRNGNARSSPHATN